MISNKNLNVGTDIQNSQARENLRIFKNQHPLLFKELFHNNKIISYKGNLLESLVDLGLVIKQNNEWYSPFAVTDFQNLFFVTDPFTLANMNRVFPLSDDESLFLANKLIVNSDDVVLDIGTGCGIYAIYTAKKAKHVFATDINDKALSYANFNAAFNGLSHKVEFCKSDVYEKLDGECFDLIVSNPATIPTPIGSGFFTHSDGGQLGTDMSEKIIQSAFEHLKVGGKIQMLCNSLSNMEDKLIINQIIKENYKEMDLHFSIEELYSPPLEPLSDLLTHYNRIRSYNEFEFLFKKKQLKKLHYLYIEAEHNKTFKLIHNKNSNQFTYTIFNGSWKERLARLFLVYDTMNVANEQLKSKSDMILAWSNK